MRFIHGIRLGIVVAPLLIFDCECPGPEIKSMNPDTGPGGTIVEVEFTGGGIEGAIQFDGALVPTTAALSVGLGAKIRFTIPYNATAGNKNVKVYAGNKYSPAVTFNVTGPSAVPVPNIEGFSIGNGHGDDITVFGTNFSTLSKVFIDNVEVTRYAGPSLPYREIPFDFVDNVIICTPASNLTKGSSYDVQVRNPSNTNSNTLNITVPNRVCRMEFDAVAGVPAPDYYVWQDNTVNTFRRTYCEGGWILEVMYDDTDIVDPDPGTEWSFDDIYQFWQTNADIPSTGYYMHGLFIPDGPTIAPRGIMYMNTNRVPTLPAANYRQGFVCFWDDFAGYADIPQKYLRTSLHEAGHGFNLLHGDARDDQTVMTTTPGLAAGWHCFFSDTSKLHLESHTINAVAPGGEAFGSGRSCNGLH